MDLNKNKKKVEIRKAIIKLIAFFDLFDYPLTSFEIWQYLKIKSSWSDIIDILGTSEFSRIATRDGFYFLKGRELIVDTRIKRYNYYQKKFKRAKRVSALFKKIPGVRMIAISNIIGDHNSKIESDIDFFIIVESGKIWTARFLSIAIIKILGLRPKPDDERDKICLNFFTSTKFLDFERLKLKDDIYFDYWITGLDPIYNENYTYEKFIGENNWIKEDLPNWSIKNLDYIKKEKGLMKKFLSFVFKFTETLFKKIQLFFLNPDLEEKMNKDTRVVINDDILKLHSKDRRLEYMERYIKNLEKI